MMNPESPNPAVHPEAPKPLGAPKLPQIRTASGEVCQLLPEALRRQLARQLARPSGLRASEP